MMKRNKHFSRSKALAPGQQSLYCCADSDAWSGYCSMSNLSRMQSPRFMGQSFNRSCLHRPMVPGSAIGVSTYEQTTNRESERFLIIDMKKQAARQPVFSCL